jgi:putative (di)nucleoside polyphosphate hydrolase
LVFTVIDSEGYRPNVGIILCNADGRLFWAKRIGQHSWQFPQGGIRRDESPEEAMFRELAEEVGLRPEHVQVIGCTRGWLRYRLPKRLIRWGNQPTCIGQKQVWFLLRMLGGEDAVCLDSSERPEFDHWQWVDYWYPLRAVVPFKRHVYWRALCELAPLLLPMSLPKRSFSTRNHDEALPGQRPSQRVGSNRRPGPLRALEMTMEAAKVAMEMTLGVTLVTASPSQPVRSAVAAKPAPVLPLLQVETCPHPVITRMVVSARRGGVLEPMMVVATPAAREVAAAPSLVDKPRSPRPPAPRSRRVSRR